MVNFQIASFEFDKTLQFFYTYEKKQNKSRGKILLFELSPITKAKPFSAKEAKCL